MRPEHFDMGKVFLNVFLFIAPALSFGHAHGDWMSAAGALLFAAAGVAVGADREKFLFGVRRENWFHYMIGTASIILALAMEKH